MNINALLESEMTAYREARVRNEFELAWHHLERAHIVSQPNLGPHLVSHWAMLGFAFTQREWREVGGQVVRLVLAPLGALTGRIPIGNTGRSNVSAFKSMPIADDLLAKIESISK